MSDDIRALRADLDREQVRREEYGQIVDVLGSIEETLAAAETRLEEIERRAA